MFGKAIKKIETFKGNLTPSDEAYERNISKRNNLLKEMAEFILNSSEEKWVLENRLEQLDEQVKSRQRVVDLAEVLTNRREVDAMVTLVNKSQHEKNRYKDPESYYLSFQPLSTWLEPAVGDGNFLVVLLSHKLSRNAYDFLINGGGNKDLGNPKKEKLIETLHFEILKSVSSLYAVDIDRSNVDKSRKRMLEMVKAFYSNLAEAETTITSKEIPENILGTLAAIIQRNIILGNTIEDNPNELLNTHKMHVVEYKFDDTNHSISMRTFTYSELSKPDYSPALKVGEQYTNEIIRNITHLPSVNSILSKQGLPKISNMKSTTKDTVLEEIKTGEALLKEEAKKLALENKRQAKAEALKQKKLAAIKEQEQAGNALTLDFGE
jgi:hypothetical protein